VEEVIKEHPVLLNRAPTLHRLGIQAFEPVLVEGRAIQLHPLVCSAYNADFDGDQMAVHVPLSAEAQAEARLLMLSTNNILVPSSGRPIVTPNQDMVIGLYYLTSVKGGSPRGEGRYFGSMEEVLHAYNAGSIELHAKIILRLDGEQRTRLETTPGRLLVNSIMPEDFGFINEALDKKKLVNLVDRLYKQYGAHETAQILDQIMQLGFHYSTRSGTTVVHCRHRRSRHQERADPGRGRRSGADRAAVPPGPAHRGRALPAGMRGLDQDQRVGHQGYAGQLRRFQPRLHDGRSGCPG